jgi:uncharacterized protein YjbI with pentapeptide repeats
MARAKDAVTPRIDPVVLPDLAEGLLADLEVGADLDGLAFEGLDLDGLDLERLVLDGCALTGCTADGARLDRARLLECIVTRLTAPTFRAAGAMLRDVHISDSRIGAAELYDGEWQRVGIEGSRIDYLNLGGSTLSDVRFAHSTFGDVDLRGAAATRVAFPGCRIRTLSVKDARLDSVDLRGADIERIDGAANLAGAVIDEEQLLRLAPLLAQALAIVVM